MSVATLAVVVTCAALGATYLFARAAARMLRASSPQRAARLFATSVGPTVIAVVMSLGVVLPAFLLFEPRHDGEAAGVVVLGIAALGALHLARAIGRALRMLSISRALTKRWLATAAPLDDSRWGLPAFSIDAGFPVVAVAGLFRSRLFVDHRVLAACSPQELDAIAAHERAHVRHRDNWRRLLMGACAGPTSREAAAWREAAERAADTRAADSPRQALNLASALLKMARLAPARTFERTALSTIHDGGSLEARVAYLLRIVPPARPVHHTPRVVVMLLVPSALVLGLHWSTLLRSVHMLTEAAVRHLP